MTDLTIFYNTTGFAYFELSNIIMILISLVILYIGFQKRSESIALIPIGFGMLFANIPGISNVMQDIYSDFSILNYFNAGLTSGIYPALILLGIGAMTDFSSIIANPKMLVIGFAVQIAIFTTFVCALLFGFSSYDSAAIGMLSSVNIPVAIFLTLKMSPDLVIMIGITIYLLNALIPILQPPIIKLLTTPKERVIQMEPLRVVSQREKMIYPIMGFIVSSLIAPGCAIMLGMFFLGNLLRECGMVKQLVITARTTMLDICTILIGLCLGGMASGVVVLNKESLFVLLLGIVAFMIATASGIISAKFMNFFITKKINPILGAAGISAIPNSSKLVDEIGQANNTDLKEHSMAPGVAGVIGSTVVAGVIMGLMGGYLIITM